MMMISKRSNEATHASSH